MRTGSVADVSGLAGCWISIAVFSNVATLVFGTDNITCGNVDTNTVSASRGVEGVSACGITQHTL